MVYWLAGFVCLYKATTEIDFNSSEYSFFKREDFDVHYLLACGTHSIFNAQKKPKTLAPYMQVLLVFNA